MNDDNAEALRRIDEVEQLRMALEVAQEENVTLNSERRLLLARLEEQEMRLRKMSEAHRQALALKAHADRLDRPQPGPEDETQEELRSAFEELQVLSEELEASNLSLRQVNHELDQRVAARTRELERLNRDLQTSEAALRAVADLVPDLLWRADRLGDVTWCNKRWYDFTGQGEAAAMGIGWLSAVHVEDRAVARIAWRRATARGLSFVRETRLRRADGSYRWFLIRAEPTRSDDEIRGWYAALTDIEEQRSAMQALAESQLRFRTLIEGIPQLVWRSRPDGLWSWASPQWQRFTGQSSEAALRRGWLNAIHPTDHAGALAAWEQAATTRSLAFEARIYNVAEQRYRHFQTRASPVQAADGRIVEWLGTATDVDDIVELQGRQQVLVAELQHRTRNLMAMVQSLVRKTVQGSTSLEDFQPRIGERLDALARVQSLLARRREGARVLFDQILRAELAAHVDLDGEGGGPQVALDGPPGIGLRAGTVQTFALALHELTTNAIKYGALSLPEGRLEVRWHVAVSNGEQRLVVDWRERGVRSVPAADDPSRGGGYGRQLIERALPYQLGAETSYRFEPDGVHCVINAPLPQSSPQSEGEPASALPPGRPAGQGVRPQ